MCKELSQAISSTIARLAFARKFLVGNNLMGMAASTNLLFQQDEARAEDHM